MGTRQMTMQSSCSPKKSFRSPIRKIKNKLNWEISPKKQEKKEKSVKNKKVKTEKVTERVSKAKNKDDENPVINLVPIPRETTKVFDIDTSEYKKKKLKSRKKVSFKFKFVQVIEVPSFKEYNSDSNSNGGKKTAKCSCSIF